MRTVCVMLVLAFAFGGCKKSGGMVDDFDAWGKATCACADEACAKKQKEAFDRLENQYEKELDGMNDDTENKLEAILDKANECLGKYGLGAG